MYILLFALWVIFNGNFTIEIALFGLVISAAIYLFCCKFFDFSFKKDINVVKGVGYFFHYLFVLIIEIFKANVATLKLILSNRYEVDPVLVSFDVHFETEIAKVLFANSITLTPGTITAEIDGDTYKVHALDASFVPGINESKIIDILHRMEALHE